MANKPIIMSKLRQVLRLYCQGDSKLHISTFTGLSRNTITKYVNAFVGIKTTWEEVSRLSDKDLDELFCKAPETVPPEKLDELCRYFKEAEKRLRKRGATLLHLWESYQHSFPHIIYRFYVPESRNSVF